MASATSIRMQLRMKLEAATPHGSFHDIGSHELDVLIPATVTGAGSRATITIDEAAFKRKLEEAGAAYAAALGAAPSNS